MVIPSSIHRCERCGWVSIKYLSVCYVLRPHSPIPIYPIRSLACATQFFQMCCFPGTSPPRWTRVYCISFIGIYFLAYLIHQDSSLPTLYGLIISAIEGEGGYVFTPFCLSLFVCLFVYRISQMCTAMLLMTCLHC